MPAGSGVRAPAAAGRFYPADPDELCRLVDGLLDAVPVPAGEPVAAGYAVPHAGYQYSGPFAAYAYARLRAAVRTRAAEQGHSDGVRRVVLIGPAHYARLAGCAVPAARVWRGPLGDVPIDVGTAHRLVAAGLVSMAELHVWMNGSLVGTWFSLRTGTPAFRYEPSWVASPQGRALSLSLPITAHLEHRGEVVSNYFDNLLPDHADIRRRLRSR